MLKMTAATAPRNRNSASTESAGPGEIAGSHGEPGYESDAVLFAVVQHVLGFAVRQVVEVLNRGHIDYRARVLDLSDGDL